MPIQFDIDLYYSYPYNGSRKLRVSSLMLHNFMKIFVLISKLIKLIGAIIYFIIITEKLKCRHFKLSLSGWGGGRLHVPLRTLLRKLISTKLYLLQKKRSAPGIFRYTLYMFSLH